MKTGKPFPSTCSRRKTTKAKLPPLIRMDKEVLQAYARLISEYAENERKEGGAQ